LKRGYWSTPIILRERRLTSALATGGLDEGGLSKLLTSARIEGTIVIMSSEGGNHIVEVLDKVIFNSTL